MNMTANQDKRNKHIFKELDANFSLSESTRKRMKQNIMVEIDQRATRIHSPVRKKPFQKKLLYTSLATCLLAALFIGSTFVSPAMAQVASKIPYLGKLFEPEPITDIIFDTLEKQNYKVSSVGTVYPDGKIMDDIQRTLKAKGYHLVTIGITTHVDKDNHDSYSIDLEIADTETRTDAIKKEAQQILKKYDQANTDITFTKVNGPKREQGGRWGTIVTTIGDGLLSKKKYEVVGIGYSVNPSPHLNITISRQEEPQLFAKELEKVVEEFLESDKMKKQLQGDSYEVIIQNEAGERLN